MLSEHILLQFSVVTFFIFLQDFELDVKEENHLTVAQQKSHRIMQSFENPFRMVCGLIAFI